ncbi:MAG: stage III sporulation protein AF [Ruminococcus sp.]|nr:stage III sporulation protein AF [Ruminococcus sp.]
MSTVTNIAVVLCTCVIACILIKMLVPQGRTQKTMNIIITAFLIMVMISPIKNCIASGSSLDISTPDESQIMDEYNSKVLSQTQDNLRNSLISLLTQNGINFEDVFVKLKTDNENGIIIDYIYIYLSENNIGQSSDAIKLTEENFSITPEIVVK